MRAVLDPNVLISALLAPGGAPAQLLRRWLDGDFELVVSEQLINELERALAHPRLRARISPSEAVGFIALLRWTATMADDVAGPPRLSRDPGDDYLLGLARSASAMLVSGDQDLLAVKGAPVASPGAMISKLAAG